MVGRKSTPEESVLSFFHEKEDSKVGKNERSWRLTYTWENTGVRKKTRCYRGECLGGNLKGKNTVGSRGRRMSLVGTFGWLGGLPKEVQLYWHGEDGGETSPRVPVIV